MASGTHTARMARHQASAESTGCTSGQAASTGVPVGLPKSVRTAAAIELIGFHEASTRRKGEKPAMGENGEVKDTSGKVIGGLFAAGEITGGSFFNNYPGGSGLMKGAVFGRLAGTSAAAFAKAHRA